MVIFDSVFDLRHQYYLHLYAPILVKDILCKIDPFLVLIGFKLWSIKDDLAIADRSALVPARVRFALILVIESAAVYFVVLTVYLVMSVLSLIEASVAVDIVSVHLFEHI